MILRFEVNQAEAFRQGVNVKNSTNHLEIDPANLNQAERDLIADRLEGIDVCKLWIGVEGVQKMQSNFEDDTRFRIQAKLPTYESLVEAVKANQADVEAELKKQAKSLSPV